MIDKSFIEELVRNFTNGKEMFLVGTKVSSTNKITVLVDTKNGVTIDECAELHRHIDENLDRETEDFELQVSSPGLDSSFMVIEQYYKNEGRKVEVVDEDGQNHSGILKNVTQGGFDLDTEVKIKGKGKEIKQISFNFEQVKTTKIVLEIK
jgi:ribosome maturation factor RimP